MAKKGGGIRVSGIFVPVELDTTRLEQSLRSMNKDLGTVSTALKNTFDKNVSPVALTQKLVKVTEALGGIRQSAAALRALKPFDDLTKDSSELAVSLSNIAKTTGMTEKSLGALYDKIAKQTAIDSEIKSLRVLQQQFKLTAQEAIAFARANGAAVSNEAASQFGKQAAVQKGRGVAGIFTPSSVSAGAQSALAATGVVTGMYGVVELTKAAYQASMRMENLQLAFESIFGSSQKAAAQLDFVRQITDELGLSFDKTADGAKKMYAAARGTIVEKDANQIFKAFSTMSAALKLTGEETDSVFLAISQMISKGKISAEELRLQLSERMPGAVTLFAKAIKVNTKELDEMLQKGQVGLDALQKFAVEVQNTYAAGAAGASKGLQAELNRVGNAWFFLKQAFVDTEGSASSLRTVENALKGITKWAPEISATASFLVKMGLAAAVIAPLATALRAVATAQTAVAASSGLMALATGKATTAFAAFTTMLKGHPILLAATALGAVVAALWTISDAQPNAVKAAESYGEAFREMQKGASDAASEVERLNRGVEESVKSKYREKVEEVQKLFMELTAPQITVPTVDEFGESTFFGIDPAGSFRDALEKLKSGLSQGQKLLIDEGKLLGDSFRKEFLDALSAGKDSKEISGIIDFYSQVFAGLEESLASQGAPKATIESFRKFRDEILGTANALDSTKRVLDEYANGTTNAQNALDAFSTAYDSLKKLSQGTDLGKDLKAQEDINAMAKSLVTMSKAVEVSQQRLQELGKRTEENKEEWDKHQSSVERNKNAFLLLGEAAIKSKLDLSVMTEGIRLAGEAAGLSEEQIRSLQERAKEGFVLGGVKTVDDVIADLEIKRILATASAGTKESYEIMKSYAKDAGKKLSLARAVVAGSSEDISLALENPAVSQEQINRILSKANETAAALDAASGGKKAKGNWESINSTIEQATKTLATWQGKLEESKASEFGATIKAEIDKIDKAIQNSKGTSEQVKQLRELREEIKRVGEERKKQIAEEQAETLRKELTRTVGRVTKSYKSLEGVDNTEVYQAAKDQYDLDAEYFKKALEKKQISQEQYNTYIKMMDATLADAQLRSQTDLFSRLQVAANDYYRKYGDFTKHIGGVITDAMDSSAKAISAFARSGASDFESLANAFASMADRMLATATDLFAQQAISALWSGIGSFFNPGPYGGAYSSGQVQTVPRGALYGPSANGNVFSGGNISSYSGSVVSSPTLFSAGTKVPAYATGAGLMGEAGPEGIFPLTRIGGKLGVRAEMPESQGTVIQQSIKINVQNNSSAEVSTRESRDNQGNVNIEMMIEEVNAKAMKRPGSPIYKSMQNTWGGRPALANV